MRAEAPNEWIKIWHEVEAKPPVKVVGYVLCTRFADWGDGTEIRPGTRQLARITQQTDRTVIGALDQIRKWGLIWRYVEGSKQGRRGIADVYRLTVPSDLITRVPLIPALASLPDHMNDNHMNDNHVNLTTGTHESHDTDHLNDVHPTSTETSTTTSSAHIDLAAQPEAEVPGTGARGRETDGNTTGHGRPSPRTAEETAEEARRQADALNEWMREHPEAAAAAS